MAGELSQPKALSRRDREVVVGLFLPTWKNQTYVSTVSGGTEPTYDNLRSIARTADEIGLAFLLPVARWKGLPGDKVGFCMYGMEALTLSAALLEATERITVFSTIHTEIFNPAMLAKMGSNLDHIGNGRWGLNIVAGWNQSEFAALGVEFHGHEDRYRRAEDWLRAVRELWTDGVSSYKSEAFSLSAAECLPRPVQRGGPVVVNAGQSLTGMRFAADNVDFLFSVDATGEQLSVIRDELQSEVGYLGRKQLLLRETDAEAQAVADDILNGADIEGLAHWMHGFMGLPDLESARERLKDPAVVKDALLKQTLIGSPETISTALASWVETSHVDGISLTLFDYERELEILDKRVFEMLGNKLAERGLHLDLGGAK